MSSSSNHRSQNTDARPSGSPPRVAIIVPARNEEANIGDCLHSLLAQDYPNYEIVVVDDSSADRTGEIAGDLATRYPAKLRMVINRSLPQGWVGKNHALARGVACIHAQWFLFTDADTTHASDSLSLTIQQAVVLEVALFSISPSQACRSFFERLIQPPVFDFLDRIYSYAEVCDPSSNTAAANGQYVLVSREAYEMAGGFEAIRGELLDDVALAERVKRAGAIWFQPDDGRVTTRMYDSARAIWKGWRKNLWLLFQRRWQAAVGAVIAMLLRRLAPILFLALGAHMLYHFGLSLRWEMVSVISAGWWIGSVAGDVRMLRRRQLPRAYALVSWAGAIVFLLMLAASFRAHHLGRVTWKGRAYAAPGES